MIDYAAGCSFILDRYEDDLIPLLSAAVLILWNIYSTTYIGLFNIILSRNICQKSSFLCCFCIHICIASPLKSFSFGPKNRWTVDKLHRKKKNVFIKAAVSGREWNKWQAVKCSELSSWSPKPRETQMTGETSPCQQQPTLLWPTDLSDGWICAGTVRDQGPPGDRGEGAD